MRIRYAILLIFGVGVCSSGCTVAYNAANTLVVEPAHFPNYIERCLLKRRTRNMAEEAWSGVIREANLPQYTKSYHEGFIDGFSEYLQSGGNGEPPPLPPRHYWADTSPQHRQLAEEWFAGFRDGAARARMSGMRELIVVPVSGAGLSSSTQSERGNASGTVHDGTGPTNPQPAPMDLHPPRKLEQPDNIFDDPKTK